MNHRCLTEVNTRYNRSTLAAEDTLERVGRNNWSKAKRELLARALSKRFIVNLAIRKSFKESP